MNALLGWLLIRTGHRHGSIALVADRQHVLADLVTSVDVVVGSSGAPGFHWRPLAYEGKKAGVRRDSEIRDRRDHDDGDATSPRERACLLSGRDDRRS